MPSVALLLQERRRRSCPPLMKGFVQRASKVKRGFRLWKLKLFESMLSLSRRSIPAFTQTCFTLWLATRSIRSHRGKLPGIERVAEVVSFDEYLTPEILRNVRLRVHKVNQAGKLTKRMRSGQLQMCMTFARSLLEKSRLGQLPTRPRPRQVQPRARASRRRQG